MPVFPETELEAAEEAAPGVAVALLPVSDAPTDASSSATMAAHAVEDVEDHETVDTVAPLSTVAYSTPVVGVL